MLDPDERAELERLRGEVEVLRTAKPPRVRRKVRWQSIVSAVLIVLGCLLAPVALATVWTHRQVADTDRFVATMSPLIQDPSVQAALTTRVTDTVFTYVDVQAVANEAVDALGQQGLPPRITDRLHDLTGPLANSVREFVHSRVAQLFASPAFAQAWDRAIRVAHEQAVKVLSGQASAIAISGDKVTLDLAPFIDAAKQQLVDAGLTAANRVPEVHPTIAIADAAGLVKAQSAYTTLDKLATWLPWVAIALIALGVYLARRKRRALVAAGLGFAASMVVLGAALLIARAVLIDAVPSRSTAPTAAAYDIVVRFLRDGLRTLLVLGLVVALFAFLAGPSVTAVRIRGGAARSLTWLRGRSGLRSGRVGGWVHTYRGVLRGAAVGLAVLILIFLDQPSGLAVLLTALLLVVILAVIQFLDQPVPAEPTAGSAETG
jgi:LPXTG-motif cell wall-anchored protein